MQRQMENKVLWNEERSPALADFFTIGYTGRKTGEILDALETAGVRTLIDIRQYAVSMYRPDLSRSNFCRLLEGRGIHYIHLPELGVPRDIRALAIGTGTRDVIWEWYDEYVVPTLAGRNLHRFFNLVEHPAALMCVELDPRECHRHRLFLALEEKGLRGFDL
jgi:uncharacterized protein (DUF488 family)